ncbi:purine and uridine phosphorylase, partial [Myriangium duriaei CBS 260.36]
MKTPHKNEFQVGWICALPIEGAAAVLMLDEMFGILDDQDDGGTNSYTLGRIGSHNIAIACLPHGVYGTSPATNVAANMMRTFPSSLRIGLMVGIGGGIPSADHDIRLGDIVVSTAGGSLGGVVQYDRGKREDGFVRTGFLNSPPVSVQTAVSTLETHGLALGYAYPGFIDEGIAKTKDRRDFSRPDENTDKLFKTHKKRDGKVSEMEEKRKPRKDLLPTVHYGIIASGNSLIKNAAERDRIAGETGAICVEMEAAGLMNSFPCIVVRGICDYADHHKTKDWQPYAALAAAAYAKELLLKMPRGQVSNEGLISELCGVLKNEVRNIAENQRKDREQRERHHRHVAAENERKEKQDCYRGFGIIDYANLKNINLLRVDGTCLWVLQHPRYIQWTKGKVSPVLWISADPGCGKSVLARSLVDQDLRVSVPTSSSICYFFFKDNSEQNKLSTALCAVLHQLFTQQPELIRHALVPWQNDGERLSSETSKLWKILLDAAQDAKARPIVCVFDALDECEATDQQYLTEQSSMLHARRKEMANQLRILITSRPYHEIRRQWRAEDLSTIHLRGEEENDQIREEINLVINVRVEQLCRESDMSATMRKSLLRRLLGIEHRTYLWLHLAIQDIRATMDDIDPKQDPLDFVPQSIAEAYQKVLERIPHRQYDQARKVLQIVVGAQRPLTVDEMATALGIALRPKSNSIEEARLSPRRLKERLSSQCGLFIFIKQSKIYLIHQTAKEFLLGDAIMANQTLERRFTLQHADELMAFICIKILLMTGSVSWRERTDLGEFNIWTYAAKYWAYHYRMEPSLEDLDAQAVLEGLYDPEGDLFNSWLPACSSDYPTYHDNGEPRAMRIIHVAALCGHTKLLNQILTADGSQLNIQDLHHRTPLLFACWHGHLATVILLLEKGADINAQHETGGNALQVA